MTAAMQLENKGIVKGLVKGRVEGIQEGKIEERGNLARTLFKMNQTLNFVTKATGLPIEIVKNIKNSLKK